MTKLKKTKIQEFFNNFSAHYNQSAFFDSKGLMYLDHIETDFIRDNTSSIKISRLLEIGFGAGRNLRLFKNRNIEIDGIDIAENMLEETRKEFNGEKLALKHQDVNDGLPYKDSVFDLVVCVRVLKYIKRWRFVLSEISRTMKKDSYAVLEVPSLFSIHIFGLLLANYFLFFIPDFIGELNKNGLKVVKVRKGAVLPFFIYKIVNNSKLLNLVSSFDDKLNKVLPIGFGSRNYIFLLKKV